MKNPRGCEGDFCAFLSSAGMSGWPRAGIVLLWLLCVSVKPAQLLLGRDFQGMLSLLCLWNPAEVTADVTSQFWLPKPMAENRRDQVYSQEYKDVPKDGLGNILLTSCHCLGEGCSVCWHLPSLWVDFLLLCVFMSEPVLPRFDCGLTL